MKIFSKSKIGIEVIDVWAVPDYKALLLPIADPNLKR